MEHGARRTTPGNKFHGAIGNVKGGSRRRTLRPRTWTSGRDEIARVLASVDETKGTHP